MTDYWKECIEIALDEAGVVATDEQIESIAGAVEGGHENYGMAFGHDVASVNFRGQQEREADEIKQRLEYEQTVPRKRCNTCKGHGQLRDGWGREHGCNDCDGQGFKPMYPFKLKSQRASQ